jgi:hypothetical protein
MVWVVMGLRLDLKGTRNTEWNETILEFGLDFGLTTTNTIKHTLI